MGRGNTYGGGACCYFRRSASAMPFQGSLALANPNFAGFPLLMRTQLDLEQPNSAW